MIPTLTPCEAWVPVVPGVKTLTAKPTRAQLMAQERAATIIQQRYERWTRYHYTRVLAHLRESILSTEDVPDPLTLQALVVQSTREQESVLRRLYLQIYPLGASMVLPDETLKSIRMYETKELDRTWDPVIIQWLARSLGVTVSSINEATMRSLAEIRNQVLARDGNIEDFRKLVMSSPAFSPARARRIAVTETNTAVNSSIDSASAEAADGREMVKRWRTSHRINVRETHRVMEGVEVPYEALYEVPRPDGGVDRMKYPGDRTYAPSPANVINCHCKSFPRLKN